MVLSHREVTVHIFAIPVIAIYVTFYSKIEKLTLFNIHLQFTYPGSQNSIF